MTAPDVDMVQRLGSNIDAFLSVHEAEIVLMSAEMKLDVDLLLMEYLVHGFNSVKAIIMQGMENEGRDYVVSLAETKAALTAKKAAEEARQ